MVGDRYTQIVFNKLPLGRKISALFERAEYLYVAQHCLGVWVFPGSGIVVEVAFNDSGDKGVTVENIRNVRIPSYKEIDDLITRLRVTPIGIEEIVI